MEIKNVVEIIQALAWPIVSLSLLFYFGQPIKVIIISLYDIIQHRGIKLTNSGIEIPSLDMEPEAIQDLISYRPHYKELLKATRDELLEQPLSEQQSTDTTVLEQHQQGLIDTIMSSIDSYLGQEKSDKQNALSPEETLKELLCDAYISLYFERIHKALKKSHLEFLSHLFVQTTKKLDIELCNTYFKENTPEFKNMGFEKWNDILKRLKFITQKGNDIILSDEGREFIHYILDREYITHSQI